jgi:hypothetical protein
MTDFYSETVRKLTDLEYRMRRQENKLPSPNLWLKRAITVPIVANVMDGRAVGYAIVDPTPATTDLNTINNGFTGQIMVIRTSTLLDVVTIKDGVGNISLPVSGDIVLDDPDKAAMLLYDEYLGVSGLWIGFCCSAGGVADFLSLSDTPGSYAGSALYHVRVNAGGTALEFVTPPTGTTTFTGLTDTPGSYASQALKIARVNSGETALEFTDLATVAGSSKDVWDLLNSTKSSADTPDDEFDGGSLDVKWTVVSGSSGTVDFLEAGDVAKYELDTTNNVLMMQTGDLATNEVELRQDWTLGDGESIIVALSFAHEFQGSTSSNNEHQAGLALNDTDTGHRDGNYMWIGFDIDATKGVAIVSYDGVTLVTIDLEAGNSPITGFLRILRDGSDYHAYFSQANGATWTRLGTYTGTTYTNMWIWSRCASTAMNPPIPVNVFHWVRQGANTIHPWSPLVAIPTFTGVINFGAPETLTISTGVVTRTSTTSHFVIAAESGTSDDLDTINGGSDGDVIVLSPDSGDTITVRDNIGNLQLASNFSMDNPADKITLIYHNAISKWCEITSSGNA